MDQLGIPLDTARCFKTGYSDRTLGHHIPIGKTIEGANIRGDLQRRGLLKPSGHELFRGAVVVPVVDAKGRIQAAYGRRIARKVNRGVDREVFWSADQEWPLFHPEALSSLSSVILCQNPLDAMIFMSAGYDHVIATLGLSGFSIDHLSHFKQSGVKAVSIAFENTLKGNQYAYLVAQSLASEGIFCRQVILPEGSDVVRYVTACVSIKKGLAELMLKTQPCAQTYESIEAARYV